MSHTHLPDQSDIGDYEVHLNTEHGFRLTDIMGEGQAWKIAQHAMCHSADHATVGEVTFKTPELLRQMNLAVDNRFAHLLRMKEAKILSEQSFLVCCQQLAQIKALLEVAGVEN